MMKVTKVTKLTIVDVEDIKEKPKVRTDIFVNKSKSYANVLKGI